MPDRTKKAGQRTRHVLPDLCVVPLADLMAESNKNNGGHHCRVKRSGSGNGQGDREQSLNPSQGVRSEISCSNSVLAVADQRSDAAVIE
jgi:hypothetical protein